MTSADDMDDAVLRLHPPDLAASFDMLVLGCGGGPVEDNLSAYLLKPSQQPWSTGFTSIDGGSCLGALTRLLASRPAAFAGFDLPTSNYNSPLANAGYVFSLLHSFLITHAHWDHISGLVLASGSGAAQKSVYGSRQTLQNLEAAMNGGLWPVLGSYDKDRSVPYIWRTMDASSKVKPSPGLTATIRPVSHGRHHKATSYESSAFFITNDDNGRSVLIFGDVEPDSVSGEDLNRRIWKEAAERIRENRLHTILIECSYTSSRPRDQLYGHLSPPFLFEELAILASYLHLYNHINEHNVDIASLAPSSSPSDLKGRLRGINVCLIHIKDPMSVVEVIKASGPTASDLDETPSSVPNALESNLETISQPDPVVSEPTSKRRRSSRTSTTLSSSISSPSNRMKTASPPKRAAPSTAAASATAAASLPESFRSKVLHEVEVLEQQYQLGARFFALQQGMRIAI